MIKSEIKFPEYSCKRFIDCKENGGIFYLDFCYNGSLRAKIGTDRKGEANHYMAFISTTHTKIDWSFMFDCAYQKKQSDHSYLFPMIAVFLVGLLLGRCLRPRKYPSKT